MYVHSTPNSRGGAISAESALGRSLAFQPLNPMVRAEGWRHTEERHFHREVEHGSFLLMDHSTVLVLADPTDPLLAMLEALPDGVRIAAGNRMEAFTDAAPEADVILNWTGSRELLRQAWRLAPRVRWIHSRSAGLDELLFPELAESAVPLTNARGVFSEILGEFVIAAVLFFAKGLRRLGQVRHRRSGGTDHGCDRAGRHRKSGGAAGRGAGAARDRPGARRRAGAQARPAGALGLRGAQRAADAGDARVHRRGRTARHEAGGRAE